MFKQNRWMFAALIMVMGSCLYQKRNLLQLVLVSIGAIVIVAPYAPAGDAANRYTYLLTAYLCITLINFLIINFKNNRTVLTFIALICIVGITYGGKKNIKYSKGTATASNIALNVLNTIENTIPKLANNKRKIFFAGIPIKHERAWVHATYFDVALKQHLNQLGNKTQIFWDFHLGGVPNTFQSASVNDSFYLYRENQLIKVDYQTWLDSEEVRALR